MKREPILFHLMVKQGIMWYTLAAGMQERVKMTLQNINITKTLKYFEKTIKLIFQINIKTRMQLPQWILQVSVAHGNS